MDSAPKTSRKGVEGCCGRGCNGCLMFWNDRNTPRPANFWQRRSTARCWSGTCAKWLRPRSEAPARVTPQGTSSRLRGRFRCRWGRGRQCGKFAFVDDPVAARTLGEIERPVRGGVGGRVVASGRDDARPPETRRGSSASRGDHSRFDRAPCPVGGRRASCIAMSRKSTANSSPPMRATR